MSKAVFLALASLFLALASARADEAESEASFKKGQALLSAKQYLPAIKQYRRALKQDAYNFKSYRSMGTAFYYLGDKDNALKNYDTYLSYVPTDKATRAFADKVRLSVEADDFKDGSGERGLQPGFSFGLGLGLLMAGAGDLSSCLGCPGYGWAPAYEIDAALDYSFGHLTLGLQGMWGPLRNHAYSAPGVFNLVTITNNSFWLNSGYRFLSGKRIWIEPRLGIGYLMAEMHFSGSTPTSSFSGTGIGFWPQVAFVKAFGRKNGVSVSLGYLFSTVVPLKDAKGNILTYSKTGSTPEPMPLNTGGPSIRLALSHYFSNPVR